MTVFVNTFNLAVFTSLTIFFTVKCGFFKISLTIFLSVLSESNHLLPVFNLFSTQWDSLYFLIMLWIVNLGTLKMIGMCCISIILLVHINYLYLGLLVRFSSLHHGCRMNELLWYVTLIYCLFQDLPECHRIKSILFHFQRVLILNVKLTKKESDCFRAISFPNFWKEGNNFWLYQFLERSITMNITD